MGVKEDTERALVVLMERMVNYREDFEYSWWMCSYVISLKISEVIACSDVILIENNGSWDWYKPKVQLSFWQKVRLGRVCRAFVRWKEEQRASEAARRAERVLARKESDA